MREKLHEIYPNYRVVLFRLLGRLHTTLIVAICCATLFAMLQQKDIAEELQAIFPTLTAITPMTAFLRGLLFALPLSLSYYAIHICKQIWQFVLCAVGLSALAWVLLGHPVGAILLALFCFFRARKRLLEEPGESALDVPSLWGLAAFGIAFFISAFMVQPVLQRLSVLSATVYLLAYFAYHGLDRLDEYLRLNDSMFALPSLRIQRIAGGALAVAMLLAVTLLLPAALRADGTVQLDLTYEAEHQMGTVAYEADGGGQSQQSLAELFEGELGDYSNPLFRISPIVTYIVYAIIIGGIAALVIYGIYRMLRGAGRSFTDSRDTVQFLGAHEDNDAATAVRPKRERIFDRSPNAKVRRRYRKLINKAYPEPPKASLTPAELEAQAQLTVPNLHHLYERARYDKTPLTNEEIV